MAGHEGVTEPGNAQHADAGHHATLEDAGISDLAELNLAEDGDEAANEEHQAHNGSVTADNHMLDKADSRRNSGGIEHNREHADQEDRDRALGKRLESLVHAGSIRSLDEALGQTFLVDRVRVEIHILDVAHHEGGEHAANERRQKPDAEQRGVAPAEGFQNAAHVNHGSGHRGSGNSDLGSDHSDGQRADRTDVLFLGDFDDNRDHGESGVAGASEDREDIRHDRSEIVDVLRIVSQNPFSNLNEVIKAARELHCGNSRDHGRNNQNHVPGDVARLHAEKQAEHENAGAASIADTNTAQTDADENCAEQDDDLQNHHDTHLFSLFIRSSSGIPVPLKLFLLRPDCCRAKYFSGFLKRIPWSGKTG